jgi:saccharopine dehydrogenase-like NADP-dependent oxidoreductase
VLDRVRELVGADQETVAAEAAASPPPSMHTMAVHQVRAGGERRRVTVTAISEPIEAWGLGGGVISTGAPAAAAVRLLARGRIGARGALPPERCVEPDDLFAELARRNCHVSVEQAELVRA